MGTLSKRNRRFECRILVGDSYGACCEKAKTTVTLKCIKYVRWIKLTVQRDLSSAGNWKRCSISTRSYSRMICPVEFLLSFRLITRLTLRKIASHHIVRIYNCLQQNSGQQNNMLKPLLKKGKIRPYSSPYGAPLFFMKEKNGRLRWVVDYRASNRIIKRDNAALPRSHEMFDRLGGARYLSKLDLKKRFHQMGMRQEKNRENCVQHEVWAVWVFFTPMGHCNTPETFQSLVNQFLSECIDELLLL